MELDFGWDDLDAYSFDFSLVPHSFLRSNRPLIGKRSSAQEAKKYYPNMKRELPKFPFMSEIKELMEDE